ncbi:MAG: hypothetical protein AB7U35_07330 [Sphingobium sp.]
MPNNIVAPKTFKYRYVTADHFGKWYGSKEEAQRHSARIGAGYFDESTGEFYAYPGTRLEVFEPRSVADAARRQVFSFGTEAAASA